MTESADRTNLQVHAPFILDAWEPVADPVSKEPDAPVTARVVLRKTYTGDVLVGTATGHALTTQGPRGASYVAQELIIGTFDGREGSFVLEHRAMMGEGRETSAHAEIVPGSGTGALIGISGTGRVEHEMLTLDIVLG